LIGYALRIIFVPALPTAGRNYHLRAIGRRYHFISTPLQGLLTSTARRMTLEKLTILAHFRLLVTSLVAPYFVISYQLVSALWY
jgi:hypothetical protein